MKLKNTKSYIINAFINWLDDSGGQPRLLLKNSTKSKFPAGYDSDPVVLFNIEDAAVKNFILDEFGVTFTARFSGKECSIIAPLECIISLHSKDGRVNIPFEQGSGAPFHVTDIGIEERKIPLKLSIIQGDSEGDGIPSGKLSLV